MSAVAAPHLRRLFVGSYGPADRATVHACTLDETRGELRVVGATSGITNPSFLAVSPDGKHLFAVGETGLASDGTAGTVTGFRIVDRGDGVDLEPVGRRPTGGDHPCHLSVHAGGRWLAVANYGTGSVGVVPIAPDGSPGEVVSLRQHEGRGPHPDRQEGPHAHAAVFTPDGRYVIAADLGIDRLLVSVLDHDTGSIRPHGEVRAKPGAGPRHLAFHPEGTHLFVVNELDNTLALYEWQPEPATLRELSTTPTVPPGGPQNIAADIRVAPSGRHVFVSNRGHDSVAVFGFERDRLTRLAVRPCGGSWPRGLGLAPGGNHLLVANERSDELVVLPVLAGDVGEPVARLPIPRPTCVAFAGHAGE